MLRTIAAAGALAAALAACAAAGATDPSVELAKTLKGSMQKYYEKGNPGLKITKVTCTIVPAGTSATCRADFTVKAKDAVGVFGLSIKIDRATGVIHTKTVSDVCRDAKTGARLPC